MKCQWCLYSSNWISHYQLDWTEYIEYNINLDNKGGVEHRHFCYFRCHEVHDTSTKEIAAGVQENIGKLQLSGFTSGDQVDYPSVSHVIPNNNILIRTEPLHIGKIKSTLYAQIFFMCIIRLIFSCLWPQACRRRLLIFRCQLTKDC